MPVLPDHLIETHAERGLVVPFIPEHINPASLDLTLGNQLLVESLNGEAGFVDWPFFANATPDDPYLIKPGQFVLAATAETITMPESLAGQVQLKSSLARQGLEHLMAGWIDPGFAGTITLELHCSCQLNSVGVWPGQRVAQIILQTMAAAPAVSYAKTGRYNGQVSPTPARL